MFYVSVSWWCVSCSINGVVRRLFCTTTQFSPYSWRVWPEGMYKVCFCSPSFVRVNCYEIVNKGFSLYFWVDQNISTCIHLYINGEILSIILYHQDFWFWCLFLIKYCLPTIFCPHSEGWVVIRFVLVHPSILLSGNIV